MIGIREPNFKRGDKVINLEDGHAYTVESINDYKFDEYWYNLYEYWYNLSGHLCVIPESALELYVEKPKSVWELKDGDECFSIIANGKVLSGTWHNWTVKLENRKAGNVFLTREEAEFEVERRKVETEMLRLGGKRKINELNSNIVYTIQMHFGLKYVYVRSFDIKQAPIGVIFFNYRNQAIKALETIGEEKIKKYIFGVDE